MRAAHRNTVPAERQEFGCVRADEFLEYKQREYDKLADVIRENMDMEYLYRVMGLA